MIYGIGRVRFLPQGGRYQSVCAKMSGLLRGSGLDIISILQIGALDISNTLKYGATKSRQRQH